MKNPKMKKTLTCALTALAALLCAASAAIAWEWRSCAANPAKTELAAPLKISSEKLSLGDDAKLSALFRCDWPARPASVSLEPGAGVQTVSGPKISLKSISWGKAAYELDAVLQPYRSGELPEGSAQVAFSRADGQLDSFSLKIPALKVEPLKSQAGAALAVAGKLPWKAPGWLWALGAALAALLLGIAGWLLWKRLHKVVPPPPPWVVALNELDALRARLDAAPASAPTCLAELSDILRRYLEARFQLHARTQTSREFLSSLERGGGPLTDAHRSFLKEFLMAADMVKFALADADRRLLDDAILRARKLVNESVPQEPTPSEKAKKGGAK